MKDISFIAKKEERLDKCLVEHLRQPRNQIEQLIKKGFVQINGKKVTKPGSKVKIDDTIRVEFPTLQESPEQTVDFDVPILYEDEDILVVNKPSGLVVHPAPSVKEATLVDWLKAKGVTLSTLSGDERHGIVHRIDKETSGALVIAKNNAAHSELSKQLQDKSMGRYYLALVSPPLKESIVVEKPIARNPKNRLKMAIVKNGRYARTSFVQLGISKNEKVALVAAKLYTGRTHQIRVHLASMQRHILGDSLYGFKSKSDKIARVFLHAYILYLKHPRTGQFMEFVAPIPDDMRLYIQKNFEENINETLDVDNFDTHFAGIERMWSATSADKAKDR